MFEVITPATETRLTTVAAVKADLGITTTDQDTRLGALIDQYSAAIATWCDRVFARETVRETLSLSRTSDRSQLALDRWPIVQVDAVTLDEAALDPSLFHVSALTGLLTYLGTSTYDGHWPVGRTVITYRTGYVLPGNDGRSLPHDIERACIMLVKGAWFATARDPSLRSEQTDGVATLTYFGAAGGMSEGMPLEVQALLSPYRIPSVA